MTIAPSFELAFLTHDEFQTTALVLLLAIRVLPLLRRTWARVVGAIKLRHLSRTIDDRRSAHIRNQADVVCEAVGQETKRRLRSVHSGEPRGAHRDVA